MQTNKIEVTINNLLNIIKKSAAISLAPKVPKEAKLPTYSCSGSTTVCAALANTQSMLWHAKLR